MRLLGAREGPNLIDLVGEKKRTNEMLHTSAEKPDVFMDMNGLVAAFLADVA